MNTSSLISFRKLGLMVFTILAVNTISRAQINQTNSGAVPVPNMAPPSAEAAALGKFSDIPVGLSSGIPNISVPIHQFKLKGLTVPVSIDYHSSGVKVDELATNVGLDWALSTGGVITQIVYGQNDLATGWPYTTPQTPQTGFIQTAWAVDPSHPVSYYNDPGFMFNDQSATGVIDTQPDVFTYSYPGGSGKFFFDQNQTIHLMPYRNIKIAMASNFASFTITDEKGNQFIFSDIETSITQSVGCSGSVGTSNTNTSQSFYLSKIVTPKNEELDYHYGVKGYDIQNQIGESRYWIDNDTRPGDSKCDVLPNCISTSSSTVASLRPSYIINTNTGERLDFNYGTTDRLDLPGTNTLDNIVLTNSFISSTPLKTFTLTHDYFTSSGGAITANNYRLRLTAIQQSGAQPYLFTYNGTILPPRLSFAQDFWGYYNGAPNYTTLLPDENSPYLPGGANRKPDSTFNKAGVLTKVTYPTGGSSNFNYEPNDSFVNQNIGTYVSNTASLAAIVNQTRTINFTVAEGSIGFKAQWSSDTTGSINGGLSQNGDNTTITLTGPTSTFFNGSFTFTGNSNGIVQLLGAGLEQTALSPGTYTITITNSSATGSLPSSFVSITWVTSQTSNPMQNQWAGGLRIKSITDQPVTGNAVTHFYEYTDPVNPARSSGVLLFPVVFDYTYYHATEQGTETNAPYYTLCPYVAQNSTPQNPLGVVQGVNVVYANVNVYDNNKTNGYTSNQFIANIAGAFLPFSVTAPQPFPYAPAQMVDWLDGLPTTTTTYKYNAAGSSFFPLSINQKTYKTRIGNGGSTFFDSPVSPGDSHEFYVRGAKIIYQYPASAGLNHATAGYSGTLTSGAAGIADQFAIGYYWLYSSWYHLDQETNTIYDQNGLNPLITTSNYYYDNPTHIQLTRTVTTKSDGKVLTAVNTYPDDYALGTTFLDDMKTNHLTSAPVEQATYQFDGTNTSILGGTITQYLAGGKGQIDKVYKLETVAPIALSGFKFSNSATGQYSFGNTPGTYSFDSRYQPRLAYNQYDAVGNPLMLTQTAGAPVSYQWGYNKTYPVAQVTNAPVNDIFYDSFEEGDGNSTTGDAKTGHYSKTDGFTKGLTGLDPGSYTLSYWSNAGSGWVLLSLIVTVPGTGNYTITIGGKVDDVRFYPVSAQMATFTLDPLTGITSSTDAKNEVTYYEYDGFQRLMNVKDKDGNITKHIDYHYQGQ